MPPSPVLAKVLDNKLCAGCGLCGHLSSGAVRMAYSADGFLRPEQSAPLTAEQDAAIARHCPGLSIDLAPQGTEDHVIWGPLIATRTGHATDQALRHQASSGGVISALANFLLASGKVDFVVQTTASTMSPIENETVTSTIPAQVFAAAGSRYAASAPLEKLGDYLQRPGRFAFIGKPCDVAALRSLVSARADLAERIPVMISFFCAGIPSRRASVNILKAFGFEEQDVASFRYRGDGWPGFATAITRDGRQGRMSYMQSWGDILSKDQQVRCKICPDGTGMQADIVCADAWETDARGYPLFAEEDGRSLIVSRTPKGEALLQEAVGGGFIDMAALDAGAIAKMQPFQEKRKRQIVARLAGLKLRGFALPRYRGMQLLRAALQAGLRENVQALGGAFRRIRKQRR